MLIIHRRSFYFPGVDDSAWDGRANRKQLPWPSPGRSNLYVATVMLDNTFTHGKTNACAIKPAALL